MGVETATKRFHYFLSQMAAVFVKVDIHFVVPFFRIVQCSNGCHLHGLKLSAVDIAFYLQYPFHKLCIRSQHPHTPTGHIVRFTHRIELNTNLFCTFYLQYTQVVVVQNKTVGIVIADNDTVFFSKSHQFFEQFGSGAGACRHVGVIYPH